MESFFFSEYLIELISIRTLCEEGDRNAIVQPQIFENFNPHPL